jgi:hypothetical protein
MKLAAGRLTFINRQKTTFIFTVLRFLINSLNLKTDVSKCTLGQYRNKHNKTSNKISTYCWHLERQLHGKERTGGSEIKLYESSDPDLDPRNTLPQTFFYYPQEKDSHF